MRYSFASFGMILVGLIAFVIVITFQRVTINNEGDYYSLKEAMEASLFESIDIPYYRDAESGGTIKIVEEKFIENFTRRFVKNTVGNSNGYVLEFYDIMESPPKASVVIKNKTDSMTFSNEDFDVVNKLTGILVSKDETTSCSSYYYPAYYYSFVNRESDGTDINGNKKYISTNRNNSNINRAGEILRAYSAINSDKYTYTYEKNGDPEFYFYNVCFTDDDNGRNYKSVSAYKELSEFYNNFVDTNNDICGYPLFRKSKDVYAYPECKNKLINNNFGTVTDDTLQLVNADDFINKKENTKYIARDAMYSFYSGKMDWKFEKVSEVEPDYISIGSDGVLNKNDLRADNLYFVSWSLPVEKQNVTGGACEGYKTDGLMLIFKVTWKVTECLK